MFKEIKNKNTKSYPTINQNPTKYFHLVLPKCIAIFHQRFLSNRHVAFFSVITPLHNGRGLHNPSNLRYPLIFSIAKIYEKTLVEFVNESKNKNQKRT